MKLTDTIFNYKSWSKYDGMCRIRTFITSKNEVFCVLTDIGALNTSASVTNAIENICEQLIDSGLVPPQTKFIEHYERGDIFFDSDSFDIVTFDENGQPDWRKTSAETIIQLLECDENEFKDNTIQNRRLVSEIDRRRYQMDPKIDFEHPEDPVSIKRRFEIENNSIKKDELELLVNNGATEQELSKLLKQDLSFFGEVYSNPNEEYICFSEFPIRDGYVDFVVFTGRSRMDIYLIEVKGANFNLVNSGHYEKFSSKVEEAAGQIRDRLYIITTKNIG